MKFATVTAVLLMIIVCVLLPKLPAIHTWAVEREEERIAEAELAEQKQLRAEYVKAFREDLRGQLESIKIKNPDGSLIDVKARHDEKMKRLSEEQAEKGN